MTERKMRDQTKSLPDSKDPGCDPFLRWVGGKRLLAEKIIERFPKAHSNYFEPFLGSGAVFFRAGPLQASLSDTNQELIDAFKVVRNQVHEIISWLREQEQSESSYYEIRDWQAKSQLDRARRVIFLNRLAFNGVWRVNTSGDFNVPYGYRIRQDLVMENVLRKASRSLKAATLRSCDFEEAINSARKGDLIYADPPYTAAHTNNGFIKYNEVLFSWNDQERLAKLLDGLVKRGVHVIASNASHEEIRKLYSNFREVPLKRHSTIAGDSLARQKVTESLFISYG